MARHDPADLIHHPALLQAAMRDVSAEMVRRDVLDHVAGCRLSAAGDRFRARMDAAAWPRGLPWKRPLRPGGLDFWRIHAFALDFLPELLAVLLPEGARTITGGGADAWVGWHPDRPEPIAVCLLGGAWDEPGTGAGGRDLVGLVAHLTGQGQGQAARWLAGFCGIEGRRHA